MNSLLVHITTSDGNTVADCSINNYNDLRRVFVNALFEGYLRRQLPVMTAYEHVAKDLGMHVDSVRRIVAGRQ
jgi:hypothetical protein